MTTDLRTEPKTTRLQARLLQLTERTNDQALRRLAQGEPPSDGASVALEQDYSDWVSTCLMRSFKETHDSEVFALLFELNRSTFLRAIHGHLRRGHPSIDANDVLQEVFLNICRYPHHFQADCKNAFRSWGHRIVKNMVLRFQKGQTRQPMSLLVDEGHQQPADPHARRPEQVAADHESAALANQAYVLFLGLYLREFTQLRPGDQRVLAMTEVDGCCYRDIGRALEIPANNVKVAVFRSRQRIHRGMAEALAALERMELEPTAAAVIPARVRTLRTARRAAAPA